MSLIEDIRKDAEAGTPGFWGLETVQTSCGLCHKVGRWPSSGATGWSSACIYEDYPPTTPAGQTEAYSNVRRIARVPAMEAALLTADAAITCIDRTLSDYGKDRLPGYVRREITEAITAYRKATEATK